MTALIYLLAFAAMGVKGDVVELSCSDNATCIDHMARELVRSIRDQKTVRLFNTFTIEPLSHRQARSNQGPLSRLITSHAISFDWGDFTFKFSNPEDKVDALDLEVFESRTAKDVSDPEAPKKSNSKVEEESSEDKKPKGIRRKRRHKRKVLQAVIPLIVGMKSAGVAIFGMAMVTVLTMKAFMASKLALMVTMGMAMKRLYESYSNGVPETSNVLWNLARYFRTLFGFPQIPPLTSPSMTMPMYVLPQMTGQSMDSMFSPTMAVPTTQ